MTVSFMIAVPFSQGRPSWAASDPCYERLRPDPTPPRGLLPGDLLVRPLPAIRQRDGPSGDCADFLMRAPGPDELRDQVDREDPDQSSAAVTARRTGCSGTSRTVLPIRSPVPQSRRSARTPR